MASETKTSCKKPRKSKKDTQSIKVTKEAEAKEVLRKAMAEKKVRAEAEINQILDKYGFEIVLLVAFSSKSRSPSWQMELEPRQILTTEPEN